MADSPDPSGPDPAPRRPDQPLGFHEPPPHGYGQQHPPTYGQQPPPYGNVQTHGPPSAPAQALAAIARAKAARPWWKKKRLLIPASLVLVFTITGIAGSGDNNPPVTAAPASSQATSSSAASAEPSAEATDEATEAPTEEPTETPTEEPTETSTEEPPETPTKEAAAAPKPKVYTGNGDDVIKFKKTMTDPMIITTSWSGPDDNNTIYAYDEDGNEGSLLVNTIGSYNGTNLMNIHVGDNVKALKIEGSGRWKVTLKSIGDAKAWDGKGSFSGSSDDIIDVSGGFDSLDSLRFKSTNAESNVTVYGIGEDEDLIVNDIGNFSGIYLMPSGVTLLRISSDGKWTMKKD